MRTTSSQDMSKTPRLIRFCAMVATSFRRKAHQSSAVCLLWTIPILAGSGPALAVDGCAPGTTCHSVKEDGSPAPEPGPFLAQCSSMFPDFVVPKDQVNPKGPWFILSQNYPITAPNFQPPWKGIKFDTAQGATEYLYALRDYSFDGMVEADFRPETNSGLKWYHMPLMNYGPRRREPTHGLTSERPVSGPELGVKPGVTIHNYAIGFYNEVGAYTIGNVWRTGSPDATKAQFLEGAMTFKILFTDAKPEDFSGPDILAGAPTWTISTANGDTEVRLLQMDVAATAPGTPTGWVFGTLAYDHAAKDASPWRRMRPVGLSWGSDPGYTPQDQLNGKPLTATIISDEAPAYARAHLGWAGRANGPVDNPNSGCLSCHSTAQFPVQAPIAFDRNQKCDTDEERLVWFRDIPGTQVFGRITDACALDAAEPQTVSLDFSLQMQVALQSVLQFNDSNPCNPQHGIAATFPPGDMNAPRVER